MSSYEYGVRRALSEIIVGVIIALVIRVILQSFGLEYAIILFDLLSIVIIIELMDKMTYWSLSYMFGWLIGLIMSFTLFYQFLSGLEIALYVIVTGVVLIPKVVRKIG